MIQYIFFIGKLVQSIVVHLEHIVYRLIVILKINQKGWKDDVNEFSTILYDDCRRSCLIFINRS